MLLALPVQHADAQFLRIGGFDFSAKAKAGAVYTTNVEQERPSEAEAEREDYYVFTGLDLRGDAAASPNTSLSIDTGITIEKHFVRDDLDNSTEPFGRFRAESESEFGHFTIGLSFSYENSSQSQEDKVILGGRSKKTRSPNTEIRYGGTIEWERGPWSWGADYEVTRTRYEKEEFQDGDTDETKWGYFGAWDIRENLSLEYRFERTKTENVTDPEDEPEWKDTETITLDWELEILPRPKLTYSLGVEKEDTDEQEGEWEPTHTLTLEDSYAINQRTELTYLASYKYEQTPEKDDVAFTYEVRLAQELNRTLRHELSFMREPASTFGSNQDTDSTTYGYQLSKTDLFIINLNLNYSVKYEINKPVEGPEERILTHEASLAHMVPVTSRLRRTLRYDYSWEDSNIEDEILDEHRVEWTYEYDL